MKTKDTAGMLIKKVDTLFAKMKEQYAKKYRLKKIIVKYVHKGRAKNIKNLPKQFRKKELIFEGRNGGINIQDTGITIDAFYVELAANKTNCYYFGRNDGYKIFSSQYKRDMHSICLSDFIIEVLTQEMNALEEFVIEHAEDHANFLINGGYRWAQKNDYAKEYMETILKARGHTKEEIENIYKKNNIMNARDTST